MRSRPFKGCNKQYGFEHDKLYIMKTGENNVIYFKLSLWDKIKIIFGGGIWFWFIAKNIPGFTLSTRKPFKIQKDKKEE